MTHFVTNR
uniref:Uncharacterized protein n=1 Tax=Anguilla anguilla TaxID=7936 RepID=A0A0E9VKI5_ANGAN